MEKKTSVTLGDIASACGVSAYTVSRAINGKKDISEETKGKILSKAKELGYVQNVAARNLRLGESRDIAIIYDDYLNPFYSLMIRELSIRLNELGYTTTLFYDFDSISLLNTKLMTKVLSSNVDGIISFMNVTGNAYRLNDKRKLPLIQFGAKNPKYAIDSVYFDNVAGGDIGTSYLIRQGKKKIGFIYGTVDHIPSTDRLEGYRNALRKHGISFDQNLVAVLKDENLDTMAAVSKLLTNGVDSIVAYNDWLAFDIVKKLKKLEVFLPVVGFDNLGRYLPFTDEIRSVSGSLEKTAATIIQILIDRINGSDKPAYDVKLPMELN